LFNYIEFCFLVVAIFQYLIKLWEDAGCTGNRCGLLKPDFLSQKKQLRDWSIWGIRLFYWSNECFSVCFLFRIRILSKNYTKWIPFAPKFLQFCHFCLLYLLTYYYAMWVNSSKSSQPHENDRAAVSRFHRIYLLGGTSRNVIILILVLG
jgi:hypothetical protein